MELEVQSHRWVSRMPDWPAAVVAGLVAGAVAMVIDLLWTTLMQGGNPWHTSHLVAAMLMGPELLNWPTQAFSLNVVAVALLTHYALGIVFGCIVAFIVTCFHYEVKSTTSRKSTFKPVKLAGSKASCAGAIRYTVRFLPQSSSPLQESNASSAAWVTGSCRAAGKPSIGLMRTWTSARYP